MHPRSQNGSFQLCCLPLFLDSHWGWVLRQENDRNPSLQKSDTAPLRIWRFFLDTIYTRFFHRINRGSPWILWFFKVYHLISYHIWWIYESYMMDIWYYMMIYIYIYMDQIFSHRYLKVSDASPPKALPWHRAWTELASAPGNRNTTDKGSFVYKGKMTQQEHHL